MGPMLKPLKKYSWLKGKRSENSQLYLPFELLLGLIAYEE
jgi:hypothetical protein